MIAFKKFSFKKGIFGSPWVGFANFEKFLSTGNFWLVFKNTIVLSFYSLIVTFPIPILFALLLNAMRGTKYKKAIQTVTYIPHFISTVVMVGIISQVLNYRTGLYGSIGMLLNNEFPSDLFAVATNFRHIYVWSAVWQNTGYSAIIYIAALSGVDQSLHEAAMIDGASRWQRVKFIDFPSILPTCSIMLLLAVGHIMTVGFEKVLLMQNNLNVSCSEVISTYVYKVGLASSITDFSYSTAVDMFNSIINFILLFVSNKISKKISGNGIF